MTLLGLDFDNTLVRYDKLFHQLALEKDLIEESLPADKAAVRDYLRSQGQDEQFTLLQGEVYGLRILEAEPAPGMLEALNELHLRGIPMVLVSHKTRTPYKGPAYDLHRAAWSWLEKHNFFSKEGLSWKTSQVYFENSKGEKVNRIKALNCSHYIDDLPEILNQIPINISTILYSPGLIDPNLTKTKERHQAMSDWSQASRLIN
jgi:hypothetical protein